MCERCRRPSMIQGRALRSSAPVCACCSNGTLCHSDPRPRMFNIRSCTWLSLMWMTCLKMCSRPYRLMQQGRLKSTSGSKGFRRTVCWLLIHHAPGGAALRRSVSGAGLADPSLLSGSGQASNNRHRRTQKSETGHRPSDRSEPVLISMPPSRIQVASLNPDRTWNLGQDVEKKRSAEIGLIAPNGSRQINSCRDTHQ